MSDNRETGLRQIYHRLDQIMAAAYFTPLAPGDALAVQFKVPALKGLPLETAIAVFDLIDNLSIEQSDDGEPDPITTAEAFFTVLRQKHPEVFERWSRADEDLVVDPVGALELALTRGRDLIEAWLAGQPDHSDSYLTDIPGPDQWLTGLLARLDPRKHPDDLSWREHMKSEILPGYPPLARPGLYLEGWAEYIRAVMDLSPRAETKARWPY